MDMKELLSKLDNIGSDIAEETVNEGYAGGDDVAHIESYLDYIDQLVQKMEDTKVAYEIQNATDDIRKALELDPTNVRAKFNEAVGDSAEAFYQLQDEFCGGECPSHAHKALIDELIRSMSGDEVKRFVDDFRRHYDMNDMEESVEETANTPELDSYIQEMDSDDQVQEDCACEDTVEETVEVAVDDLRSLIALAGLQPQATTEATVELDEYANSPDEDYQDTDVQLNKMSGGLNGPKGQHKKEYPGDNPLAAELAEKLKAMLEK